MKTKVEFDGCDIEIELVDGVVVVKAEQEGEVVEEFSVECSKDGEEPEEGSDEVKGFDEFGDEEEDFDGDESEEESGEESEEENDEDFDEDEDDETKLESFSSFFKKNQK